MDEHDGKARDEADDDGPDPWKALGIGAGGGFLIMLGWSALLRCIPINDWPAGRGAFGDSFAPVVGLFSSLALGAAVWSMFMQRRELQLTREEMTRHREAAQAQAASAERHADALEKQAEAADRHAAALEAADKRTLEGHILLARRDVQRWDELAIEHAVSSDTVDEFMDAAQAMPMPDRPKIIWIVRKRKEAIVALAYLVGQTENDDFSNEILASADDPDFPVLVGDY